LGLDEIVNDRHPLEKPKADRGKQHERQWNDNETRITSCLGLEFRMQGPWSWVKPRNIRNRMNHKRSAERQSYKQWEDSNGNGIRENSE
jgi:hypothetical protein